ncbi:MAG: tetratricopeptide repeat protein, partial [Chloroflexota bacterium]|nr:tetratricopeptide repeat protein [Chloroflexota bacterium]
MVSPSRTRHTTTADLIAEGREALLAGDKARARALLEQAVEGAPDSVEAWLWLSGTHTAPDEMARCLRQVLALDPDNQQALEGLAWLAETYGLVTERLTAEPQLPTTEARSSRSLGS